MQSIVLLRLQNLKVSVSCQLIRTETHMVLSFSFCNTSVAPVRLEPAHTSEQVTQLLFGERAEVLELTNKDWVRIRCEWDGYEGWCKISQLNLISRNEYRKQASAMAARHWDKLAGTEGSLWIPMGSELTCFKKGWVTVSNQALKFKGKKLPFKKLAVNCETIQAAAHQYLNAPYQWGGRTIAGIDCSGFTQMVYKLCGKSIPRDASVQAITGITVDFLQNAQCGDLAFFDNKEGKIVHVGILLDSHTIIHATDTSGHVVIDRIDQGGIISISLKKRTHNLRLLKRLF